MLPSFWIPSLTPEAKATKLEKPVSPASEPPAPTLPVSPHRDLPSSRTGPARPLSFSSPAP